MTDERRRTWSGQLKRNSYRVTAIQATSTNRPQRALLAFTPTPPPDWSFVARVAHGGRAARIARYATSATVERSCLQMRIAARLINCRARRASGSFVVRVVRGGRAARIGRYAPSAAVELSA